MGMEAFKKPDSSGYVGSGFKFSPEEWAEKLKKLMDLGKTEQEARVELTEQERMARERQKLAQQDNVKRIDIAA